MGCACRIIKARGAEVSALMTLCANAWAKKISKKKVIKQGWCSRIAKAVIYCSFLI
jgi:hypothetical protein